MRVAEITNKNIDDYLDCEWIVILSDSKMKEVPSRINEIRNLRMFESRKSRIERISPEFFQLKKLEELLLSSNYLDAIPIEIGFLTSLKKVIISGDRIKAVPRQLFELVDLEELGLGNRLTEIPKEISKLKNLKILDLSRNNLTDLPEEITLCENLEYLYLQHNDFKEIPEAIFKLPNLRELYIFNNPNLVVDNSVLELDIDVLVLDESTRHLVIDLQQNMPNTAISCLNQIY